MKKSFFVQFLFLAVTLAGATGCEKLGLQKIDPAETEARMQRNKAMRAAKRYEEAWNSHNAKVVAALYAEDATVQMPDLGEPIKGRTEIEKSIAGYFQAFPDLKSETTSMVAEGNKFVIEGKMTGTNSGAMKGSKGEMPATNQKIDIPYVMVATLNDSLISEDHTYFNPQQMEKQLYPNGRPVAKKAAPVKKKKRR